MLSVGRKIFTYLSLIKGQFNFISDKVECETSINKIPFKLI